MRVCANCDHDRHVHEHYRAGTECSFVGPAGRRCLCTHYGDPRVGRLFGLWDRLIIWFRSWR